MKPSILVVDDEPAWQHILRTILAGDGYAVVAASNYDEAINALEHTVFHVAVLDLRLESEPITGIGGMDLLRHIAQAEIRLPYCIILTGYPTQELMRKSFVQYDVVDFVAKYDFDVASFLQIVRDTAKRGIEIDPRMQLLSRWQLFESIDPESSDSSIDEIAHDFVEGIAELLQISVVPNSVMRRKSLVTCMLDVSSFAADTAIPNPIPLLCLSRPHTVLGDLDAIRHVLAHGHGRLAYVGLLLTQRTSEGSLQRIVDKARHVYGLDLIPLGYSDILEIILANDVHSALRSYVMSQINLRSVSPFNTTGPASDTMFFGREADLRQIVEHASEMSFGIVGGRRIGKTSLLRRLHRVRLPAAGFRTLYLDCSTFVGRQALHDTMVPDWQPERPAPAPQSLGDLLNHPPIDRPLVLLLDEADKLVAADSEEDWQVFSMLRSVVSMGTVQVILSGERALRDVMRNPQTPLFNFVTEILLGPLDTHAVEELVTQPMHQLELELMHEPEIVRRVYEYTSGHPNIVQRLCRRLIDRLDERGERRLKPEDVTMIAADPHFQEDDFLSTYWERATPLEQSISILMARNPKAYRLQNVLDLLATLNLHPEAEIVKAALDRLVDLRSILKRSELGYEFAVTAFPSVIANTTYTQDLLIVLRSKYLKNPMELSR